MTMAKALGLSLSLSLALAIHLASSHCHILSWAEALIHHWYWCLSISIVIGSSIMNATVTKGLGRA